MDISPINSVGAGAPVSNISAPRVHDQATRQVVTAVREVNKSELMGEGRQLTFSRDPQTRQPVIKVVDQNTGDVIEQLPSEVVLRMAQNLK